MIKDLENIPYNYEDDDLYFTTFCKKGIEIWVIVKKGTDELTLIIILCFIMLY